MVRGLKSGAILVGIILFLALDAFAAIDVKTVISNIEKNDKQQVKTGRIDSLVIERGNARFTLGPGDLTLYDFESGKVAAMTYAGIGRFHYLPPDKVEAGQLRKFSGKDTLDATFKEATFFFTVEMAGMPDTSLFKSNVVDKKSWEQLRGALDNEFDHMKLNVPSMLMGDLLTQQPGTYFNAHVKTDKMGEYVIVEDPFSDDLYTLYEMVRHSGAADADIISAYSPDNDLPSQRGVTPIDITHYDISSRIEGGGKMTVTCRIDYTPLRWGRQYVYFPWNYQNKVISAVDSHGDSLLVVRRLDKSGVFTSKTDEPGFGLVLNRQLEVGQPDSLEIKYECNSLQNQWGVFYMTIDGKAVWYPQNAIMDKATFNMAFDCPKSYEIVASGNQVDSKIEGDRLLTRWVEDSPVCYASFYIGVFDNKNFYPEGYPPVKVYLSKNIPHDELALYLASQGDLSSADMPGRVGADVTNSMAFYTSLFGPCPFDTIKVTEIPESYGLGTPGLVNLDWSTFQTEQAGWDAMFRAHEVAHQWWPHLVSSESNRDAWLMEGLAEYCSYWFYQMSSKNSKGCGDIRNFWRQMIFSGSGVDSEGNKAGPIILGPRLNSSKSDDYQNIVYEKGAYVFHMIRYLMHDYKSGSDDAFGALLKDMATKFKGRVITTEKFRKLLEEHVGIDMGWFFNQWVYSTEIPEYTFSSTSQKTEDGKYVVTCKVRQAKVSPGFQMIVPLTVFFKDDKYVHLTIPVDQPEVTVELPVLPYKPEKIVFNTYDAVLAKVKYE